MLLTPCCLHAFAAAAYYAADDADAAADAALPLMLTPDACHDDFLHAMPPSFDAAMIAAAVTTIAAAMLMLDMPCHDAAADSAAVTLSALRLMR